MNKMTLAMTAVLLCACCGINAAAQEQWKPIERRLPPKGIEIDPADRAHLQRELGGVDKLPEIPYKGRHPLESDIHVFAKAVRFALMHDEFYDAKDVAKAMELLETAKIRHQQAMDSRWGADWHRQTGLVVRGYQSKLDDSLQPYGLEIPEGHDFAKPSPLYVWLHGRGDRNTDMHFIHDRMRKGCPISPYVKDAIILHPFGRHCVGFKGPGEIDVLEAVEAVKKHYRIDEDRIVLMGFSMGGAGVWHIAAHYPDRWVAASPGAGFAETARYINLKKSDYPPVWEQTLWGAYDVPNYVRNLFNLPVVVYSGENDKQIQAARVMEEAFAAEGRTLPHVIGPGMGHKYDDDSLKQIMGAMREAVEKGRDRWPDAVSLQTRTLRYNRVHWVEAMALDEHWRDSRIDARTDEDGRIVIETKHIRAFHLWGPGPHAKTNGKPPYSVTIDGDEFALKQPAHPLTLFGFERIDRKWRQRPAPITTEAPRKRPGLQGPIDDAFLERFVIVKPTGKAGHPAVQKWVDFEFEHCVSRWWALYRGEPRIITDEEARQSPRIDANLVLWGDAQSNSMIREVLGKLPITWTYLRITMGDHTADAATHVPMLIYPNPLNPDRYVVINSGPTHREGHDRTNSLQNPKLGDWALVDVTTPPDALSPGRVVASGFFDEGWHFKKAEP